MGDFLEVFKKTLEEGSTGSLENPSASGYSVSEKDRLPGNAKKQFQGSFLDVFASTLKENEAKKLQAETAANAQKNLAGRSEFTRGLLRGIDTLQATYEGGVGMYNAAIGDQAAADRRFANYREQMRQASENPGTVTDFFSTDEKTGAFASPSNFGTYVVGTLGQAVPSLTEAVISGIAGAAVGAAIVPAPDPSDVVTVPAGAIGGFLGRNAMRRAIASAAQQYASRGMAQDVAEQTAERYVRQAVANRIASNVGSGLAVSQTTALHEGGGMWAEGMEKGYNSPYSAIGLGQVSGFSEALFGAAPAAVRAVLGKAAVNEAAKELGWKQAAGYAWDVVKNSGEEGVQEAFQEYLGAINQSINDPKFKLYTKENFMQWAEAAAAGAITGGVVGGGSVSLQAIRDRKRQLEEIQSKGFVSESDAQQAGIEGASRRERMANLEAERQDLDRQEQELVAQSDQEFIQQQQAGQAPTMPSEGFSAGQVDEAGGLIPQVSQEDLNREFAARMAAQGGNVTTPVDEETPASFAARMVDKLLRGEPWTPEELEYEQNNNEAVQAELAKLQSRSATSTAAPQPTAPAVDPFADQQRPTATPQVTPPPTPSTVEPEDISKVLGGFGKGITYGLYAKIWNDVQSGALQQMNKPPLFEQLVLMGHRRGLVRSVDDVQSIANGWTGDFETDKTVGLNNLGKLELKYQSQQPSVTPPSAEQPTPSLTPEQQVESDRQFAEQKAAEQQPAQVEAPEVPVAETKPQIKKGKKPQPKEIGVNDQGQTVFEDENGVRSVLEGDIRTTEPVVMRPTRDRGVVLVVDLSKREDRFKLASEKPSTEQPKPPTVEKPDVTKSLEFNVGQGARPIPGMESDEANYTVLKRKPDVIPDIFKVVISGRPFGKGWLSVDGTGMTGEEAYRRAFDNYMRKRPGELRDKTRRESIRKAIDEQGGFENNSADDVEAIRRKLYDGADTPTGTEIRAVMDEMKVEAGRKLESEQNALESEQQPAPQGKTEGFRSLPEKSRSKFEELWNADDTSIKDILDKTNKNLRAEFEARTGLTLPKTRKGTAETVEKWHAEGRKLADETQPEVSDNKPKPPAGYKPLAEFTPMVTQTLSPDLELEENRNGIKELALKQGEAVGYRVYPKRGSIKGGYWQYGTVRYEPSGSHASIELADGTVESVGGSRLVRLEPVTATPPAEQPSTDKPIEAEPVAQPEGEQDLTEGQKVALSALDAMLASEKPKEPPKPRSVRKEPEKTKQGQYVLPIMPGMAAEIDRQDFVRRYRDQALEPLWGWSNKEEDAEGIQMTIDTLAPIYSEIFNDIYAGKRETIDDVFDSEPYERILNLDGDAIAVSDALIMNRLDEQINAALQDYPKKAAKKPTRKSKQTLEEAKSDMQAAHDAAASVMEKIRNKLMSGIDPEISAEVVRVAYLYTKAGIKTFKGYVETIVEHFGEAFAREFGPYMQDGWTALNIRGLVSDPTGKVEDYLAKEAKEDYGTPEKPNRIALGRHFYEKLKGGASYPRITDARKEASELLGGSPKDGSSAIKDIDESVEIGVVLAARDIAQSGLSDEDIYDQLVDLYGRQPNLANRTSTSMKEQAYSTPAPLAFIANRRAGVTAKDTVYDSSAGNGMLLIVGGKRYANELNEDRAESLRSQGVDTHQGDATSYSIDKPIDALVINPPFGTVEDANGKTISWNIEGVRTDKIDHAISMRSLADIPENGKAVIVIAAKGFEKSEPKSDSARGTAYLAEKRFYDHVYDNYNVTDHFTVHGDLYRKQGASFPVDVIVISGKGKSQRPKPYNIVGKGIPEVIRTWEELKDAKLRPVSSVSSTSVTGGEGIDSGSVVAGDATATTKDAERVPAGAPGKRMGAKDGGKSKPQKLGVADGQPGAPDKADGKNAVGGVTPKTERTKAGGGLGDAGRPSGSNRRDNLKPDESAETDFQVSYSPGSKNKSVDTLIPRNHRVAVEKSLDAIAEVYGDIDEFVAKELGYEMDEFENVFSAEQVDALAMAIARHKDGGAFIIGDQTGVGKGRAAAAMMVYANRNGMVPVFITEKANLFADMIRDLIDIGRSTDDRPFNPLVTNDLSGRDAVPLPDGRVLRQSRDTANDNFEEAIGNVLNGIGLSSKGKTTGRGKNKKTGDRIAYNAIFTTYSQMQPVSQSIPKRVSLLKSVSSKAFFILDESHNAGGGSDSDPNANQERRSSGQRATITRAEIVRDVIADAAGVYFSSATYAKRPQTMGLYAKTGMTVATNGDPNALADAIATGGVPLQQVVSEQLVESGMYLRRERSFDGVEFNPKTVDVDLANLDNIASIFSAINFFDGYAQEAIEDLKDEITSSGGSLAETEATGQAGVESTSFSSILHNLVDQMLLAVKADSVANEAIESIKKGESPVIYVDSTLESALKRQIEETGALQGEEIDFSYKDLVRRYLERSREYTTRTNAADPDSVVRIRLTDQQLGEAGVLAYERAMEMIESFSGDMPASPIDWIRKRITDAGYSFGEITDRKNVLDYQDDGSAVLGKRTDEEKGSGGRTSTVSRFNSGSIDVVLINQSGATGISMHASEKFKNQKPRHMIIGQPARNIDTFMQSLGRVHRTGQVVLPRFTLLMTNAPAEIRPASVLMKKLASLNANVTASAKGSVSFDAPDVINIVGDQVVAEYLADNLELDRNLGELVQLRRDGTPKRNPGIAKKASGRMALRPVSEQKDFWDSVIATYDELISELNRVGKNPLLASTLDLSAKTIESVTIFDGDEGSANLFMHPASIETIVANKPGKPMTSDEVMDAVKDFYGKQATNAVVGEWLNSIRSETRTSYEDYVREATKNMSGEELQLAMTGYQITGGRQFESLMRRLESFAPGKSVSVYERSSDGTILEVIPGFVTKVKRLKGGNPLAASKWMVDIAVASPDRIAKTALSRTGQQEIEAGSTGGTYKEFIPNNELLGESRLREFDDSDASTTEIRHVGVGNILAAYAQLGPSGGQVTFFTDTEGKIRRGVLMPRSFRLNRWEEARPVVLDNIDQAHEFLSSGGQLTTPDRVLSLMLVRGELIARAPKAKSKSGKYTINPGILDAASPQEFGSIGNRMEMAIAGEEKQKQVLSAIMQVASLQAVGQDKPLARNIKAAAQSKSQSDLDKGLRNPPDVLYQTDPDIDATIRSKALDLGIAANKQGITQFEDFIAYAVDKIGEAQTRRLGNYLTMVGKTVGMQGVRPAKDVLGVPMTQEQYTQLAKETFTSVPAEQVEAGIEAAMVTGLPQMSVGFSPSGTPVPRQGLMQANVKTDTPAFKKWFGDSKVVDKDGKPLVVYHGTTNTFEKFFQKEGTKSPSRLIGFFFSPSAEMASQHVAKRSSGEPGSQVYPVYLSVKNPYVESVMDHMDMNVWTASKIKKWRQSLIDKGYDGVYIKPSKSMPGYEDGVWIAFDSTQIKSAIANVGTFDPNNPNMLMQEENPRIGMSYKDANKRVTALTEAAKMLKKGVITKDQYAEVVDRNKTVTPYDFVPEPASYEDARRALPEGKIDKFGKTSTEIPSGYKVKLRLDIPSFTRAGVWVNTIHRTVNGKAETEYDAYSSVTNASFEQTPGEQKSAFSVATGEKPKGPFATIRGNWQPMTKDEAVAKAKAALKSDEWIQVGYDPERHSYFYDRSDTRKVLSSADEVIQIGPLVLAKNPVYGSRSDVLFQGRNETPRWYLKSRKLIQEKMGQKATSEQVLGMLRKNGVNDEELYWSGLEELLGNKQSVTKDEVLAAIDSGFMVTELQFPSEPIDAAESRQRLQAEGITLEQGMDGDYAWENEDGVMEDEDIEQLSEDLQYDMDVVMAASEESSAGRYAQYTIPGGENYRELLIRLPVKKKFFYSDRAEYRIGKPGDGKFYVVRNDEWQDEAYDTEAEAQAAIDAIPKEEEVDFDSVYESGHWSEHNVLAHLRFNERVVEKTPISEILDKLRKAFTNMPIDSMGSGMPAVAVSKGVITPEEAADWSRSAGFRSGFEDKPGTGVKTMFIEEIQSDWHQEGRKKGYAETESQIAARLRTLDLRPVEVGVNRWQINNKDGEKVTTLLARNADDAINRYAKDIFWDQQSQSGRVPDAPFKKSWPMLAMKRAIQYAVENGFDRIAWATGEQQAERYDLSEQIDSIAYWTPEQTTHGNYRLEVSQDGDVIDATELQNVPAEKLEDYVGKEMAQRIIEGDGEVVYPGQPLEHRELKGANLKVGGEGMKAFYDRILPSETNKLIKKFGGKVGQTTIKTPAAGTQGKRRISKIDDGWVVEVFDEDLDEWSEEEAFDTKEDAQARINEYKNSEVGVKVQSFDITPAMRQSALQYGQPLFQQQVPSGNVKGWTKFISGTRALIGATSKADISTVIHEFAHPIRRFLLDRKTPQDQRADITDEEIEMLEKKCGAGSMVDGEWVTKWDVPAEEKFARMWEQYWFEGKSPNSLLNSLFEKISRWMRGVYQSIQQITGGPLAPEVRELFDKLVQRGLSPEQRSAPIGAEQETSPPVPMAHEDELTSNANAVAEATRAILGIKGYADPARESFQQWIDEAKSLLRQDPTLGERLRAELSNKARSLTKVEEAVLSIHLRHIKNLIDRTSDRLFAAKDANDSVAAAQALRETDMLVNQFEELTDAINRAGSETARALVARKIALRSDFTQGNLLRMARIANGGKELGEEKTEEIIALSRRIAELEGQLEKKTQEAEDLERKLAVQQSIDEDKKDVGGKPSRNSLRKKAAEKAAGLAKKLSGIFVRSTATDTLQQTEDEQLEEEAADVIKAYVDAGVYSFGEFMSKFKKDIGMEVPVSARAAFSTVWAEMREQGDIPTPQLTEPDTPEVRRIARMLQRSLVEDGIVKPEEVIEGVYESLQEILPEITRREAMDAMSGYGQYSKLSPDPNDAIIRDLNGQYQQMAKLDDMRQGMAPKKTGGERRTPSDKERELIQQVNQMKRNSKYFITDPESQLKSIFQSTRTALRNRIYDLDRAINVTGTPIPGRSEIVFSGEEAKEIADLRKRRDELMAEYKRTFPKPGATFEQRAAAAERAADRAIAEIEKEIASGKMIVKGRPEPISTPALNAKLARLDALKAAREAAFESQIKEREEQRAEKAYIANLLARIADYEDRKRQGYFEPRAKKERRKLSPQEVELSRQLVDLKDEFFRLSAEYRLANMGRVEKAWDNTKETMHLSRAIMTSFDLSAVFRQGGIASLAHPRLSLESAREMRTAIFSQSAEFKSIDDIEKDSLYTFAMQCGLPITTNKGKIERQEEAYMGRLVRYGIGKKGTKLNKFTLLALKPISASARAYTVYLNSMRFKLFKYLVSNLGVDGSVTLDEGKVIAAYVGVATGRAELGKFNQVAANLNTVFFAPRYVASRFQYLAMPFYILPSTKVSGRVKKMIAMEYARHAMGLAAFLGLSVALGSLLTDDEEEKPTVEFDPRSSDFMKLRIGETRIDPMAGLSQTVTLIGQLSTGQKKQIDGDIQDLYGKNRKFGDPDLWDVTTGFIRKKLAPIPGAIVDLRVGENVIGEKETPLTVATDLFIPLSAQEVGETMKARGLVGGLGISALSLLGMGGGTYGPRTAYATADKAKRLELLNKDLDNVKWDSKDPVYSDFLTVDELEKFKKKREQRKQSLVYAASADPKRKEHASEESFKQSVAERDKAFDAVIKAGMGYEEIKQLLIAYYKRNYGSAYEIRGGNYQMKESLTNRLRAIKRKMNEKQPAKA